VERDHRPPVATFFVEGALTAGGRVALGESAAHHARVKRLEIGDPVRVSNGDGTVGRGALETLGKRDATIALTDVQAVPPLVAIHLRVPIGDRDRMLMLAEKAAELGVTTWQGVRFRRSLSVTPRGEGAAFHERVKARMVSALEQSGGAWMPRVLPDATPGDVSVPTGAMRILLDVAGAALPRVSRGGETAVIFGPEGGLEPEERETLIDQGWEPASLARTTLRFETAGIAALAVLRAAETTQEV
jgi:16S rRNA (uracil1498-N3)-methyltransferase